MKTIIYKFDPVIYPFQLLVTKEFDSDELCAFFDVLTLDDEIEEDGNNGFYVADDVTARMLQVRNKDDGQSYYLLVLKRPQVIGAGICTHEALHITNAYLQYLGFEPAKAYLDEPYAYFAAWVANCMDSVLRDYVELMKGVKFNFSGQDEEVTPND